MMNRQGRPTAAAGGDQVSATFTGNRGLEMEEPLVFEIGTTATSGVSPVWSSRYSW